MKKLNFDTIRALLLKERCVTIPTAVTLLRVALIPFIMVAITTRSWFMAFALFGIAALTDLLDGALARLLSQQTALGACLDPVADKLLILGTCMALTAVPYTTLPMPSWFVLLLLLREVLLVAGASLVCWLCGPINMRPSMLGKLSTFVQMLCIVWALACICTGKAPLRSWELALSGMTALSTASFGLYAAQMLRIFGFASG